LTYLSFAEICMKQINLPFKRKKIIFWLLVACFLIAVLVVWLVFFSNRNFLDQKIFSAVAPHISERRTRIMKAISFLGNHLFLIPANISLLIIFLILHKKWEAIRVTVISLGSLVVMSLLKNLFRRHRPDHPLVENITNFSFPSGHAFMSTAFYGLLIWWAATHIKNKWQRRILIILLFFLILIIGFSRIYLRVHYASDVIVGFCIGFICLIIFLTILEILHEKSAAARKL
jgi:membrane-associated phospholipid phosphatase